MATIIKAGGVRAEHDEVRPPAFNLDDITAGAEDYLAQVKRHAAQLVAKAKEEAEQIKRRAETEGRQSANVRVEQEFRAAREPQLAALLAALRELVSQINLARQEFIARWEQQALHLAVAIAQRIVGRELVRHPEITSGLVREALKMAGGCGRLRVALHPADHALLGADAAQVAKGLGLIAACEIVSDDSLPPGSCRVLTEFGEIDNSVATQLRRIEEELAGR